MEPITILERKENTSPKFLCSEIVTYENSKRKGLWELINFPGSVHVIIDVEDKEHLSLVKQIRIPVLANDDSNNGEVIEACAGLVDKDISIVDIAREEIEEELGYKIPNERIKFIKSMKANVGMSGGEMHCFTAKVHSSEKVFLGGGIDSEDIEEFQLPYVDVQEFVFGERHTDAVTSFLLSHWMLNKK